MFLITIVEPSAGVPFVKVICTVPAASFTVSPAIVPIFVPLASLTSVPSTVYVPSAKPVDATPDSTVELAVNASAAEPIAATDKSIVCPWFAPIWNVPLKEPFNNF
ncbi:hypothetical protein D3C75_1051290 [compost metagenome]